MKITCNGVRIILTSKLSLAELKSNVVRVLRVNGFDLETRRQNFNQDVDNTKLSIIHSFYFYLRIYLSKLK